MSLGQRLSELGTLFGGEFCRWHDGKHGWTRESGRDAHPAVAGPELASWFERLRQAGSGSPAVQSLGDGRIFAAQWWGDDQGAGCILAAELSREPAELASRLAAMAGQQWQLHTDLKAQQQLLEQYADRLTESFEELTVLRRVSRHIEHCDVGRELVTVAGAVLPPLRALINVEAIALVSAPAIGSPDRERPDELLVTTGQLHPDGDFWLRWIDELGSAARRVVVRNFCGAICCGTTPHPKVRSYALAPVAKNGVIFGWLLVVNKCPPANANAAPANSLGHDEIGSMEMSLVEAAATMLGTHAANEQLFSEKETLVVDVIHTLVGLIEARDAYTCGHSDRVALFARRLAEELGLGPAECHEIFLCGLLHDIGKVGIADDVLLKPGKLSDEEFTIVKRHPEIGAKLLQGLSPLASILPGVLHHHESYDGTGYPHKLQGENIPYMARILAVADAFDAMISDRPYRAGMSLEKAESILDAGRGKQWDAHVVAAYFAARQDLISINTHWRDQLRQHLEKRPRSSHESLAAPALRGGLSAASDQAKAPAPRTSLALQSS
ncbi:MAG: HD-GYP domain-containing protein [Pirellulaceae bacterium]